MYWACQHPEKLQGLVVVDIAPKEYPPHHQAILKGLRSLDFSVLTSRKEVDQALEKAVPDRAFRQFLLKNVYWIAPGELRLRVNIDVLQYAGEAVGAALPEAFCCSRPTLFIRGEHSQYITYQDRMTLKHHFSKFEVQTVSGAGHFLHVENPKQFSEILLNWVNAVA